MSTDLLYTSLTRFGTLAFIVFIVVVLLRLYQYLMRLATYYESRADALELAMLSDVNHADLVAKFSAVFSGDKIDFGPQVSTPMESLAEVYKSAKKDA